MRPSHGVMYRYMTGNVLTTPELLKKLDEVAGIEAADWFRRELARGPEMN